MWYYYANTEIYSNEMIINELEFIFDLELIPFWDFGLKLEQKEILD